MDLIPVLHLPRCPSIEWIKLNCCHIALTAISLDWAGKTKGVHVGAAYLASTVELVTIPESRHDRTPAYLVYCQHTPAGQLLQSFPCLTLLLSYASSSPLIQPGSCKSSFSHWT